MLFRSSFTAFAMASASRFLMASIRLARVLSSATLPSVSLYSAFASSTVLSSLLVRANEQRAGARIPRPRALAVVPIMPLDIASAASFSSWTADLHDYWMYRLGNMVLMQGKEGQIDRLTEYGRRRDRVLLRADSCRFPQIGRASCRERV